MGSGMIIGSEPEGNAIRALTCTKRQWRGEEAVQISDGRNGLSFNRAIGSVAKRLTEMVGAQGIEPWTSPV